MPFVLRDDAGEIYALLADDQQGQGTWMEADHPDVLSFLSRHAPSGDQNRENIENQLNQSDLEMVRVIEDVLELLISKNLLMFTDLPFPAQQKLLSRRQLRGKLGDNKSILLDEDGIL